MIPERQEDSVPFGFVAALKQMGKQFQQLISTEISICLLAAPTGSFSGEKRLMWAPLQVLTERR